MASSASLIYTSDPELAWYAIHVKSRQEKRIADSLSRKGFEIFLPTQKARRLWSDRVKEIEVALFPTYVFARFDPRDRLPIVTTPSVFAIVGDGASLVPVPDHQIESVRRLSASGQIVHPCPFLKVGQKVLIERGSLAGVQGILTRIRNTWRVVVSVDLVQQSVSVEVDRELLRVLR